MKKLLFTLAATATVFLGVLSYYLLSSQQNEVENPLDSLPIMTPIGDDIDSDVLDQQLLILVNIYNKIPDYFRPDLTAVGDVTIASIVVNDLIEMRDAATRDGIKLYIASAYRTAAEQEIIFNETVASYIAQGYTEQLAAGMVARPGYSEHQTGLAIDFSGGENQDAMQDWLRQNSYKYGFIERYPAGGRSKTGYNYEPWHYRYVGKEHARAIFAQGIVLEEYLDPTVTDKCRGAPGD